MFMLVSYPRDATSVEISPAGPGCEGRVAGRGLSACLKLPDGFDRGLASGQGSA